MKYIDIIRRNRELATQLTSSPYRIAVISNITIAQIADVMELSLREEGINAQIVLGDYDSIVQDSVKFASLDSVIIFWEAGNFVNGLHNRADSLSSIDYDGLASRIESEIALVLGSLRDTPLVLINKFSSYLFDSDPLKISALSHLCHRLNGVVEEVKSENHIVVDVDHIISCLGHAKTLDYRQYQQSKSLYKLDFYRLYSSAVKPAFLSASGRAKKILVLDCDNTLWGGVIGEDGVEGIVMSDTDPRGIAFNEVQILIKGLRKEGVLLALCSKNNAQDVDNVLENHSSMILKDDDLVAKKVNWNDKASNMREISVGLNIGLDSFVFIDDSPFEIGFVREDLPEVLCFQVPDNLSEYPALIRKIKTLFFNLSKTEEDAKKTKLYQQEVKRKAASQSFTTVEDYLSSLGLCLDVKRGADIPVARVAQLTQKTNQFNLTTKRYTEAEIRIMMDNSFFEISSFELSDRYGQYGTTGVAIISLDDARSSATIDTFLMSCRVIGRNVENQFFAEVVNNLINRRVVKLEGKYIPTLKNEQVSFFYENLGFSVTSDTGGLKSYSLSLQSFKPKEIPYISSS